MASKEAELKKYLEKKKKQKTRDSLMAQIAALSKNGRSQPAGLVTTKVKKKKAKRDDDGFENRLFGADGCGNGLPRLEDASQECEEIQECEAVRECDASHNVNCDSACEWDSTADCRAYQPIQGPESTTNALKDKIIGLREQFEVKRCAGRTDGIQEQRKRLDIFYDEAEIVSCIKYNLITFVQGATGCGKTTQIPQFLLENGFAAHGLIGITQPRRFSAISISARLNAEMNESLAGFRIKYEHSMTGLTRIKVVTEGILFREIQSGFLLKDYSVIILDEVHERSSNIDILIGLLSRIVQIRFQQGHPLRLVLMSATVDVAEFRHVLGEFATLELSSRMFRVNVFYEDKTTDEYLDASYSKILSILEAERPSKAGKKSRGRQAAVPTEVENDFQASILVFLPGKEDIYSLKARLDMLGRDMVVLPLHSSLSKSDQNRVYRTYTSRKVVLATNIAETSVTIDDIVFVVDSGRVKHRIMDHSTVLYRVDLISKSSARQRMGRAGRTRAGVCYRIYSGDTYEALAPGNIPQILMEPLDSSLLQLKAMGVQNILSFPFVSVPSEQAVGESLESLQGMGAIDGDGNITKLGRRMCHYPVPPRYARLLLMRASEGIFDKLAVVVSILVSSLDLKKTERTQKYFVSERSDLVVALKIVLDYLGSPARRRFACDLGISVDCLEEIRKMSSYLMKLGGRTGLATELGSGEADQVSRALYCAFADQLAMNSGSSYLYKNGDVFVSGDSIDPGKHNIVFDHIVCGNRKSYARGITAVLPEWFG